MRAASGHSLKRRLAATVAIGVCLATASGSAQAQTAAQPQKTTQPPKGAQPQKAGQDVAKTAQGGVSVFIAPVEGAPGDGAGALSSALKKRLTQQGLKVSDGRGGKGAYTVKATVSVGEASSGSQPVTIKWVVTEPQGNAMLNALIQRNKVPAGSLDGPWGATAEAVADEAAKALLKMLPQAAK